MCSIWGHPFSSYQSCASCNIPRHRLKQGEPIYFPLVQRFPYSWMSTGGVMYFIARQVQNRCCTTKSGLSRRRLGVQSTRTRKSRQVRHLSKAQHIRHFYFKLARVQHADSFTCPVHGSSAVPSFMSLPCCPVALNSGGRLLNLAVLRLTHRNCSVFLVNQCFRPLS